MSELLPCPFCGGQGVMNDLGNNRFHIHCDSCPAQIGQVWDKTESEEFLIVCWNRRHTYKTEITCRICQKKAEMTINN